jgi:hypothetical protein
MTSCPTFCFRFRSRVDAGADEARGVIAAAESATAAAATHGPIRMEADGSRDWGVKPSCVWLAWPSGRCAMVEGVAVGMHSARSEDERKEGPWAER